MLNQDSMTPLYVQLMNEVEKSIKNGEYKPGDKLLTETEMAKKYGVTIKKEEAENYFHYLANHKSEELDDDMLEDISAGIDINRFKLFFDSLQ